MNRHRHSHPALLANLCCLVSLLPANSDTSRFPGPIRTVIEVTQALPSPLVNRLPLFLWPAHAGITQDPALQEEIIRALHSRRITVISTWDPNDFADTTYTLAMPVVYPWARIHAYYDFEPADFRWFYNLLLVGSNAARHTPASTPLIPFVHYHTVFDPLPPNASTPQMSPGTYQDILWHLLLRGADSLFLWCAAEQDAEEVRLVHEVWAASLQYADFLESGRPITHHVPASPGPVISGLQLDHRVLVRRTDFTPSATQPVTLEIGERQLRILPANHACQILTLQ